MGKKELVKYNGSDSVVIIPDCVECIGEKAFSNMDFIDTVIIPDSVTNIGYGAFLGSSISHITIKKSVTQISAYAFSEC